MTDDLRCDLVLGGGGVRGAAHIGALTALEEADYRVARAAGASAGAIAGAFAVAGVPSSTLRELFEALDMTRFVFADVVGRLRTRRGMARLADRWSGQQVEPLAWLTEILGEQGIETFGDLRVQDADADEPLNCRYRLVVRCLDVLQRRVVRLPWDYPRYGLDPDRQSVAEAVRASMSIPFVYDPIAIGGEHALIDGETEGAEGAEVAEVAEAGAGGEASAPVGEDDAPVGEDDAPVGEDDAPVGEDDGQNRESRRQRGLLIDGGLTSGFPVTVLDRQDGARPRWPTFGIRLLPRAPADGQIPRNGVALARMVVDALLDSSDLLEPMNDCDERRTVRVDLSETSMFEFADPDRQMFADGYEAMGHFLRTWDFDAYLRDCGR